MSRIVTGDEMWVHHHEPESKRQSMEWKHPGLAVVKEFGTQSLVGKVMLTVFFFFVVFFNLKGLYWKTTWKLVYDQQCKIQNFAEAYCWNFFCHMKMHANMSGQTVDTNNLLGFEVLEHPAYSPDLLSSDYHILGTFKNVL